MSVAPFRSTVVRLAALAGLTACSVDQSLTTPAGPPDLDHGDARGGAPAFNLNVELEGRRDAEGLVRFRQPDDGVTTIFLDTRLHELKPNHDYYLQRAAQTLGLGCVDADWLTLGEGPVVKVIHTDRRGNGTGALWRTLPASLIGASFDIHFRVIDAVTGDVVLASRCYQYTVRGT